MGRIQAEHTWIWRTGWLFAFGSLIGFFLEGIWGIMHGFPWMSHATLLWGPFCPVYGLGAVAIYWSSELFRGKPIVFRFFVYAIVGSGAELAVSFLQELLWRAETWNYSDQFLNLDGRISFGMTLLWGILGFACAQFLFPTLSRMLDRMNGRSFHVLCLLVSLFLAVNFFMSSMAINRWRERLSARPASSSFEEYLDAQYDNDRMEDIFTNLRFLD